MAATRSPRVYSKPKPQVPKVVFLPESSQGFQRGINAIAELVRPTLGPVPRYVVNDLGIGREPEILDSSATIARRVIQIQDRDADMGAMFIRQMLWKLYEEQGDGTATAAVLFQKIYNEGLRYITAGGNAMALRQNLEKGMKLILDQLTRLSFFLEGEEALTDLARTISYDLPLSRLLGEIFDVIGEYGHVEIEAGQSREMEREYIEGMVWDSPVITREMIDDPVRQRVDLENAAIVATDLEINEPAELVPLLERAVSLSIKHVLLIASLISDRALGLLLAKQNRENVRVIVVKTPGVSTFEQADNLQDISMLTGCRPVYRATGNTIENLQAEDIGYARLAWGNYYYFGIVGGRGNPRQLRSHIASLRAAYSRTQGADEKEKLLKRIGKLIGGNAILYTGGFSPLEIKARKELAERTTSAMRGAMHVGVLPGGGVALLACRGPLKEWRDRSHDSEERIAAAILLKAMEEPFCTILKNAGLQPGKALEELAQAGPGSVFDVSAQKVVKIADKGLYDSASVVKAAVRSSVLSAGLALTTEVLVHLKYPQQVLTP